MLISFNGSDTAESTTLVVTSGDRVRVRLNRFEGAPSLKLKLVNLAGETSYQTISGAEYWVGSCAIGDTLSVVYNGQGHPSAKVDGFFETYSEQYITRDPGLVRAIASNSISRQANTTAYSAGQLIGGSATAGFDGLGGNVNGFTFSNFARFASTAQQTAMVRIDRIRMYKSQANLLGTFELALFRGKPAISIADGGSFSAGVPIGFANASARLVARFAFDFTTAVQGSDGSEVAATTITGLPALVGLPANGTDMFGLLRATAAYNPLAGEQFNFVAEGLAF